MNTATVHIKKYKGDLDLIQSLHKLINKKYSELFYAVIVHGSIATNEVIKYSDFDGLLIVKDKWLTTKELEKFKIESLKLILQFDPLQHHGWFQIKESELNNYPEDYLPLAVLENSSLIFPNADFLKFQITTKERSDYKRTLIDILDQMHKRAKMNWKPKNMFQLKSFLSQIMLLPSLYYSAVNSKGIHKKDSFSAVRPLFSDEQWLPIATATAIRSNWNYALNPFQKVILSKPGKIYRKLVKRALAPKIRPEILDQINDSFFQKLELLITKIRQDLNAA